MCRFVAYIGKKPMLLHDLFNRPRNALVTQSFNGKMGTKRIHADGYGFGWYDLCMEATPYIFKSIQPAWNDPNFSKLASHITSTCFVGHIRAASVGTVSWENTHPFTCDTFLFVHNGTIHDFSDIKHTIVQECSDDIYTYLHGQTDSEYFFALLMHYIKQAKALTVIDGMIHAYNKAIQKMYTAKEAVNSTSHFKLNTVLTNGKHLIATRFVSDASHEPVSLFYTRAKEAEGFVISSEPLTENMQDWIEVPKNHMLIIEDYEQLRFLEIPLFNFCVLFILLISRYYDRRVG